jgi:GT2 family glycosyltransferase
MACKYVCTYSLAISKSLFKKIGWFRKNYIFYGFEDTDLGYRLNKAGVPFYLSPLKVYHLYHDNERSEFFNKTYYRHLVLSKTAKIFFLNHLDPEIYEHFISFMQEKLDLDYLLDVVRRLSKRKRFFLKARRNEEIIAR